MLVRELIEQLSEMPPELPVVILLEGANRVDILAAKRKLLDDGSHCAMLIDPDDLRQCWQDYAINKLLRVS